jgi:hypothetical protein
MRNDTQFSPVLVLKSKQPCSLDFVWMSHIQQICINMVVMEYGWGRSASGGWENYGAVSEYRHLTAFFLKWHTLKILPVAWEFWKRVCIGLWEFTVCAPTGAHWPTNVFILTLQECVWFVHRLAADTLNTHTLSLRECGLNKTTEWGL